MKILRNFLLGETIHEQKFKIAFGCLLILALIHVSLDIVLGKSAHLMMGFLVWTSIFLLLWDKRQDFQSNRHSISFVLGCALLTALLVISIVRIGDKVVGFYPLFAFLGWLLTFIGFDKIKHHTKELCILLAFGIPKLIPDTAFGLNLLTAKFSAFSLWYIGYPVQLLNEINIQVPNGNVDVVPACSGVNLITHLLSISIIFLCLFPVKKLHYIFLPLLAIFVGFIVNGARIALLAILSPVQFSKSFHYWHSANGASLFVLLALMIYGFICFYIFNKKTLSKRTN